MLQNTQTQTQPQCNQGIRNGRTKIEKSIKLHVHTFPITFNRLLATIYKYNISSILICSAWYRFLFVMKFIHADNENT